jgi:hypothetical protein
LVVVKIPTVSVNVIDINPIRTIDWHLIVVRPKSVSMSVCVREKSALQHLIERRLYSRDEVGRREGGLFCFGMVILRVLIKSHFTYFYKRVIAVRPHFSDVKDIPFVIHSMSLGHYLNTKSPGHFFALLYLLVQMLRCEVRVLAGHLIGLCVGEVLNALVGFEMKLNPEGFAALVDPSIGVRAIAVHMGVPIGRSSVGEKNGNLVGGFRDLRQEVPKHIGILKVVLGVSFLSVDEVRELHRVSYKEHRRVVADHVPVAFFGVELNGESSWVSFGIGAALFSAYSGEPYENRSLLSDLL